MDLDENLRLMQELQQHTESKGRAQALTMIENLAEVEDDPIKKGTWYYRAGWICDEHLKQRDVAVEHCNTALDCYFANPDALTDEQLATAIKPLQAIERIMLETSDWRGLDRAYRKMIVRTRTPTNRFSQLQAGLYDRLGALYLARLGSKESAMAAFEEARRLDPNNEVRTPGIDRDAILNAN
jgi:tetratricopeptide (TPR) repeat protein